VAREASVEQLEPCRQPQMVASQAQYLVRRDTPTFVGGEYVFCLGFDAFSAEQAGINGPCARPDHRGSSAKSC